MNAVTHTRRSAGRLASNESQGSCETLQLLGDRSWHVLDGSSALNRRTDASGHHCGISLDLHGR